MKEPKAARGQGTHAKYKAGTGRTARKAGRWYLLKEPAQKAPAGVGTAPKYVEPTKAGAGVYALKANCIEAKITRVVARRAVTRARGAAQVLCAARSV